MGSTTDETTEPVLYCSDEVTRVRGKPWNGNRSPQTASKSQTRSIQSDVGEQMARRAAGCWIETMMEAEGSSKSSTKFVAMVALG